METSLRRRTGTTIE